MEQDPHFQEIFENKINAPSVPEANNDFILYMYDDTYLNMEISFLRDGNGHEFYRVMRCLRKTILFLLYRS